MANYLLIMGIMARYTGLCRRLVRKAPCLICLFCSSSFTRISQQTTHPQLFLFHISCHLLFSFLPGSSNADTTCLVWSKTREAKMVCPRTMSSSSTTMLSSHQGSLAQMILEMVDANFASWASSGRRQSCSTSSCLRAPRLFGAGSSKCLIGGSRSLVLVRS